MRVGIILFTSLLVLVQAQAQEVEERRQAVGRSEGRPEGTQALGLGRIADVEVLSIDRHRRSARFRLTNRSEEVMTGWSLSITTVYLDGETTQMDLRQDYFLVSDLDEPGPGEGGGATFRSAVWPGREHRGRVGFVAVQERTDDEILAVEVDLNAVLLANRSAFGDPVEVAAMLDFRNGYVDGLGYWLGRFETEFEAEPFDAQATFRRWQVAVKFTGVAVNGRGLHYERGFRSAASDFERVAREGLEKTTAARLGRARDVEKVAESLRDGGLEMFRRQYRIARRHRWINKQQSSDR